MTTPSPDRPADWLALAAAPAFGAMTLLTATQRAPMALCAGVPMPLDGMAAMYLLMSLFHLSPWLRLVGRRRAAAAH